MIRYKILGADDFDKTKPLSQNHINSDMGHFSIRSDPLDVWFEEIIPPPKQLWIKAKVEFDLLEDIAVIQKCGSGFAWHNDGSRCKKVNITPTQILYAQKDNLEPVNWQVLPCVFEHQFAVAESICAESTSGTIDFWPCGGKVSGNILEIEQLYAQVSGSSLDQKVYVNSQSACSKLMARTASSKALFHPPAPQKLSLIAALNQESMLLEISDGSLVYRYTSVASENPSNEKNYLQILCERKD